MQVVITGTPKGIAALALELQERQMNLVVGFDCSESNADDLVKENHELWEMGHA